MESVGSQAELVRLTVCLPALRDKQLPVARAALRALQWKNPEGGSWVEVEGLERQVSRGWWDDPDVMNARRHAVSSGSVSDAAARQKFPLITDDHIVVSLDVPRDRVEKTIQSIIDVFAQFYLGEELEQDVIYVSRQNVEVFAIPGRTSTRSPSVP